MLITPSLEDSGIVTRCEITTFDASEIFDLPYDDDERVQKLILNVSYRNLLLEFEFNFKASFFLVFMAL